MSVSRFKFCVVFKLGCILIGCHLLFFVHLCRYRYSGVDFHILVEYEWLLKLYIVSSYRPWCELTTM